MGQPSASTAGSGSTGGVSTAVVKLPSTTAMRPTSGRQPLRRISEKTQAEQMQPRQLGDIDPDLITADSKSVLMYKRVRGEPGGGFACRSALVFRIVVARHM